eukprot:jgi/Ulvmu1/313/UM001_0317.1
MEAAKVLDEHGLLKKKCTNLYNHAQAQAKTIAELHEVVRTAGQRRTDYEDVTIKLKHLWDQICDDLSLLAQRAVGELADQRSLPKPKMEANGVYCKDPFLAALLASDVDISEERFREESRLAEEYSKVEVELQKRAEATSRYMQQVLELVRVLRDQASTAVQSTDSHSTPNGATTGSKAPVELVATQKQLDVQRGRCRSLQSELRYCTGQLSAERHRCMELENRLADKSVDIEVLQKRLQEASDGVFNAVPSGAGAEGVPPTNPNGARRVFNRDTLLSDTDVKSSGDAHAVADAELALTQAQQRLQEAWVELDAERTAHRQTQQAVRDAEATFADDSQWVPQTGAYRRLQEEHARSVEELARAHADKAALEAALRREQEALRLRHSEFNQLHHAAAQQEARAVKLEAELARVRAEAAKRELALADERDARGEPRHFEELKKFHDSYQQVRGSLERCLELLQTKAKTKEEAPGTVNTAAEVRAEAAEAQVQQLRTLVADAEAEAAGHREAHEAALAAQAELQSMLTALCAFADDPRDLVACRSAEAAAKADLDAARAAAADAAAVAAAGAPPAEAAAAAAAAATAPEPRSAAVDAALWRARATAGREDLAAAAARAAAAEREVARLSEDLEAAKDYEGSMMKEVSDTGEAFAKLQGERGSLLQKLSASEADLQKARRELSQYKAAVESKDGEISRLLGMSAERETAVSTAEARMGAINEALAESARIAGERDAARAAERAALASAAAERAAAADAAAAHAELQRQVGEKSARITQLQQHADEAEGKAQRAADAARDLEARLSAARVRGATREELTSLQQSKDALKDFIACAVCNTRPRDHVISKCWHTFCGQCVGQRVTARSRKCPKCNVAFSASDVHEFFA